jgi:predicted transglutaminase-like cysteine proteinase/thiol-disulfide isomerase/thioredoxin
MRTLLTVLLLAGLFLHAPAAARAEGRKAISFVFTDIDGRTVRLADLRGKWVLVNFWAAWCPLCWIEVPALNELNRRKDFAVIGIGLDYGPDASVVRNAVAQHRLDFYANVAGGSRRDPDGPHVQVGPVDFFPTSYLYDPTGEIVMFIPGQLRPSKVLAFMDAWNAKQGGAPAKSAAASNNDRLAAYLDQRFGEEGHRAYLAWSRLLDGLGDAPDAEKLARVNGFFNGRIRQGDGRQIWGRADYWASPGETLGEGRGDSEDLVIAKYFTLLRLGIPDEKLRLVYTRVRNPEGDPAHMVLAYYPTPDQEPLLLDSREPQVKAASRRPDLKPVFSFNSETVWGDTSGVPARLTAWQDVLKRARNEGFE